ncbi:hypothetical protein OQA88_43 [Cercophora sp. LCS_1]
MADETPSPQRSPGEHKTRRPHRKSRFGCTKCKDRRIKCDEGTPKCSRCTKMNLNCQYPKQKQPEHLEVPRVDWVPSSPESPDHSPRAGTSPESPALSSASSLSTHPTQALLQLQIAQALAPTEFELVQHFLEHTCRDLTVGSNDQYALQIGIPNLACHSKPLMRSVLALAAVCKCCDIVRQPSVSPEERLQVMELLSLADQYHMESLQETQVSLHGETHYDSVLATSAMMGMYGSGSHTTRIWLAKTATFDDPPLYNFMPKLPQWINLFRAASIAYAGLLSDSSADLTQMCPARSPLGLTIPGLQFQYEYQLSDRGEQPRVATNHPLYPILAATTGSAVAKLHSKAMEIALIEPDSPDLQACFTALTLFNTVVSDTFPDEESRPSTPGYGHLAFDVIPMGRLSEVSPWLRRYAASITSMIPSRLPRRFIMSFIHKAPAAYLTMVEDMMSLFQTDVSDEMAWTQEPSMAHQLAIDIFAHWMVLVILLENVWWIGGIGAWELQRIVSVRSDIRWRNCLWNKDDDWWPESMYEVSRQFDKYRNEG